MPKKRRLMNIQIGRHHLFAGIALLLVLAIAVIWAMRPHAQRVHIVIGCPSQPLSAPLFVADEQSFFTDMNLDVKLVATETGKQALDLLRDGAVDFAVAADTPIMRMCMEEQPLRVMAMIAQSSRNPVIIGRSDLGITTVADLVGKRLGFSPGTNAEYYVESFLTFHGIDTRSVHFVPIEPNECANALITGEIDAVSTWDPITFALQRDLGDRITVLDGPGIYLFNWNIVASKRTAVMHGQQAEDVLQALQQAIGFISSNPDLVRTQLAKRLNIDPLKLARAWNRYHFDMLLDQALLLNMETQARWAMEKGYSKRTTIVDFLDYIWSDPLRAINPSAVTVIQ